MRALLAALFLSLATLSVAAQEPSYEARFNPPIIIAFLGTIPERGTVVAVKASIGARFGVLGV